MNLLSCALCVCVCVCECVNQHVSLFFKAISLTSATKETLYGIIYYPLQHIPHYMERHKCPFWCSILVISSDALNVINACV